MKEATHLPQTGSGHCLVLARVGGLVEEELREDERLLAAEEADIFTYITAESVSCHLLW